jgi:hypothetical protein
MNARIDEILFALKQREAEFLEKARARERGSRYQMRQRKAHCTAEATAGHRKLARKIHHYLHDAKWLSVVTAVSTPLLRSGFACGRI